MNMASSIKTPENIKPVRSSNIELLRILSIIGVIILHYNNRTIGGGFEYSEGINHVILSVLESVFISAVNIFVLISGYFMSKSQKRNIIKPLQLIVQVIIFSEAAYLIKCAAGSAVLSLKSLFSHLIPCNYFVILYVALYFISPFLNIIMDKLNKKQSGVFVLMLTVIFSLWNTCVDFLELLTGREWQGLSTIGIEGSQSGYTIVNFVLMYLIGSYIRKYYTEKESLGTAKLILVLAGVVAVLTAWQHLDSNSALSYFNPLVIMEAVIVFLLFLKIRMQSRIINTFSGATFSVFLLHTHLLPYLKIERFVTGNPFLMILHVILSSILIYIACWGVFMVYDKVMGLIYNFLTDKIPVLKKDLIQGENK